MSAEITERDDWQAREAQAAGDEQRRHPRDYPRTRAEQLGDEFTPETPTPERQTNDN